MDSSESSEDENFDTEEIEARNFEEEKKQIISNLLPKKSRAQYELAYASFLKWKSENKADVIDESVMIVYFKELSKKFKPSSLWSIWSKLRTTLSLRHAININDYHLLKSFMKNESKGYKPKKANILSWAQVKQFLTISDDNIYLATKVCIEIYNIIIYKFTYLQIITLPTLFTIYIYTYIIVGYSDFWHIWSVEMQ